MAGPREGTLGVLSPAHALAAAWVLREAPTNVRRHARAETVRIATAPGTLTVDDDVTVVRQPAGNGLRGMAERAAAAGAALRVGAAPTRGTRVELRW